MYEKILIATDGSQNATMALEVGLKFSIMMKLKPIIVNVMDVVGPLAPYLDASKLEEDVGERKEMRDTFRKYEKESERILSSASKLSEKSNKQAETILLRGVPYQQLIHYAGQRDLLLIGAHGKDAKKKFGTGNMTEKIVRHMPCDVLVIRNKMPHKKIMIALDGSKHDELTCNKGLWFAGQLNASVAAVHVVSPKEILAQEIDRTLIVAKAKEKGEKMGVKVRPILLQGLPIPKLISLSSDYDLLVMGTLGNTSLHDFLIGSTAERVTRHAKCSVLVVRSQGFQI